MKKVKFLLKSIIWGGFIMFGTTACVYETIVPEVIEPPTDTVSFSEEIVPIFDANCNGSGCHKSGGIAPDLSAANAYNALISGNYIDTADPENSKLYKKIAPGGTMAGFIEAQETALILGWIQQGAENN